MEELGWYTPTGLSIYRSIVKSVPGVGGGHWTPCRWAVAQCPIRRKLPGARPPHRKPKSAQSGDARRGRQASPYPTPATFEAQAFRRFGLNLLLCPRFPLPQLMSHQPRRIFSYHRSISSTINRTACSHVGHTSSPPDRRGVHLPEGAPAIQGRAS
jgi:hypothetical protein